MNIIQKFIAFFRDGLLTFRGILEFHFFLNKSQFMTLSNLEDYQKLKIKKLLSTCKNHPFYEKTFSEINLDINAEDILLELKKLPIITKDDIKKDYKKFFPIKKNSLKFQTSGTTGEPLNFYTSPIQWINEQATIWRHWNWAGYKFRDKMVIFRSYAPRSDQPLIKVDKFKNWTYFSVFNMNDVNLFDYFEYIKKWKPKFLRGYPSSLRVVGEFALKHKIHYKGFKAAFTASEVLDNETRQILRSAFKIEIFDHYGQAEISCMFHECEKHNGLHYDMEYAYVELEKFDNDYNKIIATNLHNHSMPLLRYDTGDLVKGNFEKCTCKRSLPIIKQIKGRKDKPLIMRDGSRVSTVNLYTFFAKQEYVKRFQVIQEKPGIIDLILQLESSSNNLENKANEIKNDLIELTGLEINCSESKEFRLSKEGKFSTFVIKIS